MKCRKIIGKACKPPDPPPLPGDRVQDLVPFSVTGIDFAGPLQVKDESKARKMYICLFTCAVVRAIHLELVPDLTTESFLLAFRRFTSRCGNPKTIISDNAPTFKKASTVIQQKINLYPRWKFIPVAAPWFGGFYERMIGLTKLTLKKVLGRALVKEDNLRTILSEIEKTINSRPLTYISSNIDDAEPLTPQLLLSGRSFAASEEDSVTSNTNLTRSTYIDDYHRQQKILRDLQKRWRNEYLTARRENKSSLGKNNQKLSVGDVVLMEENIPVSCGKWDEYWSCYREWMDSCGL